MHAFFDWKRLLFVILFTFSICAHATSCLEYSVPVALHGKLSRHSFPEQPNYESVAKGDAEASYFFITPLSPLCVAKGTAVDGSEPKIEATKFVQLVFENADESYSRLRPYLGKDVVCDGYLFAATTGHHHSPVLLWKVKCNPVTAASVQITQKQAVVDSSACVLNEEAIVISRLRPLTKMLNRVLLNDGMVGVQGLVESCYYAPKSRGYDCLILDMGAMFLDSVMTGEPLLDYFNKASHIKRVNDAIESGDYTLQKSNLVQRVITPLIGKTMVETLDATNLRSNEKCIVIDPDIADSFIGECIGQYAEGYGVAKGRDVYRGDFKRGEAHGKGQYTHGSNSPWSTEVFRGSYFRSAKNGFGVLSIFADSKHPALESLKKNGIYSEGRYIQTAMYSAGKALFPCNSEEECLKKIPNVSFLEVSDHISYGGEYISMSELRNLTSLGISTLSYSRIFNSCMVDEIIYDYFGQRTIGDSIRKSEIKDYYRYLTTKRMVTQPLLYCLQKR